MKQIDVLIDESGNPTIETSGFTGGECAAETAALEKALGAKTRDTKTPEYWKQNQGVIKQ
jgi:hypothetical protein